MVKRTLVALLLLPLGVMWTINCSLQLPQGAVGWPAVCDCGISLSLCITRSCFDVCHLFKIYLSIDKVLIKSGSRATSTIFTSSYKI